MKSFKDRHVAACRMGTLFVALAAAWAATGCASTSPWSESQRCAGDSAVCPVSHTLGPAPVRIGEAPAASCTSGCDGQAEARVALAVTRPSLCNDFPVTYRVMIPDTESRVRHVDRVNVY